MGRRVALKEKQQPERQRVEGPGVVSVSPWLTVVQAAAYLSMSRSNLYRATQSGELVPDGGEDRRHGGDHGWEGDGG